MYSYLEQKTGEVAPQHHVSPASGSGCWWCPNQRCNILMSVSSSEVQHASMAGQSGHARNCQAILLNAWPPLPHYGKTATSRLCGMSRDSSGWHFGTAPPSRSCWRSRRLRLSSVSSQLFSKQYT